MSEQNDNPYSSLSPLVGKKKSPFHPSKPFIKYLILLLLSTICFGAYYSYNEIGPIEHSILTNLNITYIQYGLLYSVYSIPNIILPFVGGSLADRLGLHRLAVICR
jgi:MFS family permease